MKKTLKFIRTTTEVLDTAVQRAAWKSCGFAVYMLHHHVPQSVEETMNEILKYAADNSEEPVYPTYAALLEDLVMAAEYGFCSMELV